MRLILVRHTEAVNLGQEGVASDFERHLTPYGHSTAQALANHLNAMKIRPDAVACSPLVRARQTAKPLLGLLGQSGEPIVCEELAPDVGRPKKIAKALNAIAGRTLLAVSHLPDISLFAGWLVGGNTIDFKKGTAAFIETDGPFDQGSGTLVWLLSPACYLTSSSSPR
jgi:phosphohistidine phosphatase